MGEQKEEDLYCNFSRKDLQGLCKKYGLPANKSNSEMATSLILYLEKKNLCSRTIWEATRRDPFPSVTSELLAGARMNSNGDRRKDCRGRASHSGSGNSQLNNDQDVQQIILKNCRGPEASDKTSEDVGVLTELQRDSNSGAGRQEKAVSSVVSSTIKAPSPSFTFDVSCNDGIQLYVDLNSSTSDWIESLKSGVHICQDVHRLNSQSFHQELGRLSGSKQKGSSVMDSYNDGQVEDGSYPTTMGTGAQSQANEPGGEGSLSSAGLIPVSNAVDSLQNSRENQPFIPSRLEAVTEKEVCGGESCIRSEEIVPGDSDINTVGPIKKCCNLLGNSSSCDFKGSGLLEQQGLDAGNNTYNKPSLQQTGGSLDPVPECRGSMEAPSMEMCTLPCTTSGQHLAHYPSPVAKCLDLSNKPENVATETCGFTNSVLFHGPVCQMKPIEASDQGNYGSCSPFLNSHSPNPTDPNHKVETENGRAAVLSKSSRQMSEPQTHLASSPRKRRSESPYKRSESLGIDNVSRNSETENVRFLNRQENGKQAIETQASAIVIQQKNASLSPSGSGGSLDFAVPKLSEVGHCTSAYSNELSEDIHKSQQTSMRNLGERNTEDGRERTECLKFGNFKENTWRKPAGSESNGVIKRKRKLNSVEDQSKPVNPDPKILRSSKQFAGTAHSSRRRSSRLFTK